MSNTDFPTCPVCGSAAWTVHYEGPVRRGGFGESVSGKIARCSGCGIDRLGEALCLQDADYRAGAYRAHLGQDHELAKHFAAQDELARFTLETIWPRSLRGKIVADVGCGGGSLLDHLHGVPQHLIAIDPDEKFADSLKAHGYRHFFGAADAGQEFAGRVDSAFAIQVIEHVSNPRAFLSDVRALLAPDGWFLVSTPNRADILMDILPGDFPSFFYRTQHRWYFDAASLACCAEAAGFAVVETRHVHRYGMANAMLWLRDRKPSGRAALAGIDPLADDLWRSYLESSGRADNLYMLLRAV